MLFRCYPAGGFAPAKHLWSRLGNARDFWCLTSPFLMGCKNSVFWQKNGGKLKLMGTVFKNSDRSIEDRPPGVAKWYRTVSLIQEVKRNHIVGVERAVAAIGAGQHP